MRVPFAVSLVLLAGLAWTANLGLRAIFEPARTLLIGLGLILPITVAVVGMVVTSGRWARRLALMSVVMMVIIAAYIPVDAIWLATLGLTAVGGAALFHPSVIVRKLPSATGPPARAILIPLTLLVTPFAYGLFGGASPPWALLVVGLTAPAAAFLYSGVKPGGLFSVRYLWPLLGLALAPVMELSAALISVALAVSVLVLAWSSEAKIAFHPPRETGSAYPIPPELSPTEVLDAANLDQKGRPR